MVAPHLRVTWSGTLGTTAQPVEIWQFSMHWADAVGTANSVATANALLTAWGDYLGPVCSKTVRCTQVKIAKINDTGKTSEAPTLSDRAALSGAQGTLWPYQIALAVSLRSDKYGKGPLTHGRFYIPVPGLASITELDRIQNVPAIADKIGGFLGATNKTMSTNMGGSRAPILVSSRSSEYAEVKSYSVGDVLDTVRRRRGKIKEVKTPITL